MRGGREGWTWRWAATAVAIAVSVACVDEFLQSRSMFRTGTPADVLIDFCGAVLGTMRR